MIERAEPGDVRTVMIPRCEKCSRGQHGHCEHPRHVEGAGPGSVATCCCAQVREKFVGDVRGKNAWVADDGK